MCSSRSSSASTRRATSGQSAASPLRCATSTVARIDATGLRSSWDASDTNRRCRSAALLESIEHRVHRAGQLVDLVAGSRLGDALVHARAVDRGERGAHRVHRAQRPTDEPPREQRHGEDERGDARATARCRAR